MKCGLIYLKIVPSEADLSWIRYCNIFDALPDPIQEDIKIIVDSVNFHYKNEMFVPLTNDVQNGCIVKSGSASKISTIIFNRYNYMMSKYDNTPSIRLVYSEGSIIHLDVESVHRLYPEKMVVDVGQYLNESCTPGFYVI